MFEEHDRVVLTKDVSEYGLRAGDVGTIVHVYDEGTGYAVEFLTLPGETIAVVTLDSSGIRPVGDRELTHARTLD
jgi:hypothetical protein